MKELKREMMECKSSKLLDDLNIEGGIEIDEIKKTEIELEKLKMSKSNC